jgi:hypothetical protein
MKRNQMIVSSGNEEIATRPIRREANKPRSHGPVFIAASMIIDLWSVPRSKQRTNGRGFWQRKSCVLTAPHPHTERQSAKVQKSAKVSWRSNGDLT